ncbi:Bardet-Biedl syndrome 7 -like protein [Toxocara canis]|uniref:Bardet-Biedl syndrome 7-like protein n=1 Tax=Toxocara canis TaxID=6265 RepID=A0A0B2UV15_TOXCA|nr:Bardet-Biedl syndrome 7 -like protein [Toxocara canis]
MPIVITKAHQWLNLLISQVPERAPPQETVTFNFASTFNGGTQLQVTYSRGSAMFRSDNISTIAIIRDVLSKEVTRRQIKVDIQCEMNEDSILHTLQLLHPKMEYQNNLMRRLELAQALKELADNGDDLSYLSAEMRELLDSYDKLHDEALTYGVHLDRLIGIITDLYIDKERMAGRNGKAKIEELLRIVSKYDATTLQNFFMEKNFVQQ